ncbi:MAG: hypothetical protein MZV64_63315 [Ignavibacteriales bacterium]|nr:hypothetical protein [Ignavibacteriales bacterium]
MVGGVTGRDFSVARLEEIENRVAALERQFNLEAGADGRGRRPARPLRRRPRRRRGPGADASPGTDQEQDEARLLPGPGLGRGRPADGRSSVRALRIEESPAMSATEVAGDRGPLPGVPGPRPGLPAATTSRTATAGTWPSAGPTSAARTRSSSRPRARRRATSSRARSASSRPRRRTTATTRPPPRPTSTPASWPCPASGPRCTPTSRTSSWPPSTTRPSRPGRPTSCPSTRWPTMHLGAVRPGRLVRRAERLARAGPDHPRAPGRPSPDHHLRARGHGQGPDASARPSTGSASATTPGSVVLAHGEARRRRRRGPAPAVAADPARAFAAPRRRSTRSRATTARISGRRRRSCRNSSRPGTASSSRACRPSTRVRCRSAAWTPCSTRPRPRCRGTSAGPCCACRWRAGPSRRRRDRRMHKAIYAASDFQTVMHCPRGRGRGLRPTTSIPARPRRPTASSPSTPRARSSTSSSRVLPPDVRAGELVRAPPRLQGRRRPRRRRLGRRRRSPLSEVLHHPSSAARRSASTASGAVARGLDLRRMEPAKAQPLVTGPAAAAALTPSPSGGEESTTQNHPQRVLFRLEARRILDANEARTARPERR